MPEARSVHLAYLEGIRGWAAVFVALHHVWQFVVTRPDAHELPRWFTLMTVFKFGGYAVPVFIVLSGYCLMLPGARSTNSELSGGVRQFAVRRARRILIPYYAALALSVLLVVVYPRMAVPTHTPWDTALPSLAVESVVSHLLLVHNWFPSLQWTIDPPMWSVATEWQIYFLFALLLLPLWRRFGTGVTLSVAFALGLLPLVLGYRFASSWFLGLFACGMVAAAINFRPGLAYGPKNPAAWEKAAAVLFGVAGVHTLVNAKLKLYLGPDPIGDVLVGFGTAFLLVAATRRLQFGLPATRLARVLEHPVSIKLGEFSYSTYLVHYPIIALLSLWLMDRGVGPFPQFVVLLSGGLAVSLLVAYAFHRAFERPFMRRIGVGSLRSGSIPPEASIEELKSAAP